MGGQRFHRAFLSGASEFAAVRLNVRVEDYHDRRLDAQADEGGKEAAVVIVRRTQ
jgi:hypothetical protein